MIGGPIVEEHRAKVRSSHTAWKALKQRLGLSKHPSSFEYAALPSYGEVYFNHLIGEFDSLKSVCNDPKAINLAEEIVAKSAAGKLMTWGDAYALDEAIAQMLPVEYLHQRAWCLEARYRDAVGNAEAYDAFMKVASLHLINESEPHLRARVHNLIRELYRLYTVIACREEMRERLARQARITLIIILSAIAVFSVITSRAGHRWVDIWGLVFAAGALGGLISLQRRLQALPSHGESLSDLVELSSGMTIKLAPIIGGTFAIVLFLIFCAGLASGDLFPKFQPQQDVPDFVTFATSLHPVDLGQWGKLLVWSFIAGFAERFVPDTLDRLIARNEQSKTRQLGVFFRMRFEWSELRVDDSM
jgi:hypothetical protein